MTLIVLDWSPVEQLLEVIDASEQTVERVASDLCSSRAYDAFLAQHRKIPADRLVSEIILLKRKEWDRVESLGAWRTVFEEPKRLVDAMVLVRNHVESWAQDLARDIFLYLPSWYARPTSVICLVDGISIGYRFGYRWAFDLVPLIAAEERIEEVAKSQLHHIFLSHQLDLYFDEYWYQHAGQWESAAEFVALWVSIEVLRRGITHHLATQQAGQNGGQCVFANPNDAELTEAFTAIKGFVMQVPRAPNPEQAFREALAVLRMGRYDVFQVAGAYMTEQMIEAYGRRVISSCLSNPMEAYQLFRESRCGSPQLDLSQSLWQVKNTRKRRAASAAADPSLTASHHRWPCARIIPVAVREENTFCVEVHGAGAEADRDYTPGLAHLAEHWLAARAFELSRDLRQLRAETDHYGCRFLCRVPFGNCRSAAYQVLDVLREGALPDPANLERLKSEVRQEIGVLGNNPFFSLQERLLANLIREYVPIRGSTESVDLITSEQIGDYLNRYLKPEHLVVFMDRNA